MVPIRVVFEKGAFVPAEPCDLPEGTRGTVTFVEAIPIHGEDALKAIVSTMRGRPLPGVASRFSREELHERG
jgi:predicted DNA-binding antitoxin AbrB/MazE fold protein